MCKARDICRQRLQPGEFECPPRCIDCEDRDDAGMLRGAGADAATGSVQLLGSTALVAAVERLSVTELSVFATGEVTGLCA